MKFSPIYWVLSSVVLLAGVGMMGVGAAMEYNNRDDDGKYLVDSFENVGNIKVEVSTCSMTLKSDENAENCTVEFINATGNPKMYMEGNTLHVEQKQKQKFRLVNFGDWQKKGEFIITVPDEMLDEVEVALGFTKENEISSISCKKMQLDCGVGDMTIRQTRIFNEFDLDGGTGDMVFKDVTVEGNCDLDFGVGTLESDNYVVAKKSDIDFGTGDCTFRNSEFSEIEMGCGVGDLKLESVKISGDVKIKQGTGDIRIDVADSSDDYSVEVEKGVGDVSVNGKEINGLMNKDAKYDITVESGVGDISISFLDEN